ncbi:MAG TPA: nicotinate-nicotinamide nucleotide adenylyltransferase [Deltaproteobacteria bacterium]|nr:MAG: nicotinate (nicotinamide) nucleotide adenylyltransferase [Deltaproteobacteria bacterium GWA2_55_82]OGQ63979.1 MAG: nicotinate (nicotinamide) nucleotide adenylyltransferase [Deltaproteobacteria bacterium RIFCSPLOWO2_02_FULL_55_12]OIJ73412.1 MAG: nicotinate (nicotinamide) nucleotide adenylyltransferase [Deltaproteobacteria bacterium GWC2_55_46]HBG47274.1 nicotinate-nicotinamide nucleotide adenylyltransferase [Deltaproteobacteria bacterium]HCY10040.1 nicotinate-nicotinamide nucleotide aden
MRIAVLGGTFNPIHFGHLRIAEEAREACLFDKVVFIPACVTPHKPEEALTPPELRFEMVKAAIEGNPAFELSDIEIRRGGRSFTIDTVRELTRQRPSAKVSLIIGNDSFNEITTWCEYEELLKLASFVVVQRPHYPAKKPGEALPVEVARKFWYDSQTGSYVNSDGNSITYLNTTMLDISSSDIRCKVQKGLSIRYLLPDVAARLIESHGLYK